MSHYKPYPAYKDSGVEWLGKVPEHWSISRVRNHYQLRNGFPFDSGSFSPEGVSENRLVRIRDLSPSETWVYTNEPCPDAAKISNGDVIIGMDGDFNAVLWRSGTAKLNQRLCAVRGDTDETTKLFLYLIPTPLKIINDTAYATTVKHLSSGEVLSTRIALPPASELSEIMAHLDRETARIDALIEKKTRFIELLREKRQALITHAVTKGLNPNAKMKDSGVEWLGEVPEHWDALPLRRVVESVKTGGTPSEEQPSPDADGLAWFTPGDFSGSLILTSSEKRVSALAVSTGEAKVFPAGSVLIVSIGATLGKVGYITNPASANQQINAVIPNKRIDGYFLAHSLSVKAEAMWFLANAATIGIMNQEKTKEIWLAVPPPTEQKEIAEYLDERTVRIDSLIFRTERSIDLLKERRSALITAAVTGQIDLREAS